MPQQQPNDWVDIDDWVDVNDWQDIGNTPAPISSGKSHGPIIDTIWNFGKNMLSTPARDFAAYTNMSPQERANQTQQFGQAFNQNPIGTGLRTVLSTLEPQGGISGTVDAGRGMINNIGAGNYGQAAVQAGAMALPAMGLRGLLKGPRIDVLPAENTSGRMLSGRVGQYPPAPYGPQPQGMLPAKPNPKMLPALGETGLGTNVEPRFYQGMSGIADQAGINYPYQIQRSRPQVARGHVFNATEPIPGGRTADVGLRRPDITTPNIGAELSANRHALIDPDPIVNNSVFGALIPQRYQKPTAVPITPPMLPARRMPEQINHEPTFSNPRTPNLATAIETPRAVAKPTPYPGLNQDTAVEFVPKRIDNGKPVDPVAVTKTAEKLGWDDVREALNLSRAILTTGDFGALLRQGANNIHKKAFWTSIDDMFRSFGSDKFSKGLRASIEADPFTAQAQRGGLNLSDLKGLNNREESIMSTWVEEGIPFGKFQRKVLGTKGTTGDLAQKAYGSTVGRFLAKPFNRAHTDFLNKVRIDDAKKLAELGRIAGKDYEGKDFGEWQQMMEGINIATGRATFPKSLDRYAGAANSAMLAPRYTYSQWQMLNPMKLEWKPWSYLNSAPSARKEQMKSLLAGTALGGSMYSMYKMAGGEEQRETDPKKSDFMKLKFGEKIYADPWGGKAQQAVLMGRILDHVINGKEEGPFGNSAGKALLNYGRGKLSPVPSFFTDYAMGNDMSGQPFEMRKAIAERAFPIVVQDMKDLLRDEPEFAGMIVPAIFGSGVQIYNKPVGR